MQHFSGDRHRDFYHHWLSGTNAMTDEVKRIEVDIAAAMQLLVASPELVDEMNRLVGGPALVDALAEIEQLKALIYRNCNSMTANEMDAQMIREIAAALDPKP